MINDFSFTFYCTTECEINTSFCHAVAVDEYNLNASSTNIPQ